jgi:hypothetical protein
MTVLAIALLAAFAAGVWLRPWLTVATGLPLAAGSADQSIQASSYYATKGIPNPEIRPAEDPRRPEERAVEARRQVIDRDVRALRAECQRAAGGDWEKWQTDTAPYRAELQSRINALHDLPEVPEGYKETKYAALESRDGFPLFEVGSRLHLNHLLEPALLDGFRRERPVVAARNWLNDHGIDLIFVSIPKMSEVYVEHFLERSPPDGVIAPHVRRTLLELLESDVEVVDGFGLFRPRREADAEYLYNATDTHWAPRGMRIMAKEVADRIERYNFGTRARFGLPIVHTSVGPYTFTDIFNRRANYGRDILNAEQAGRAARAQTTNQAEVRTQDGKRPQPDPASPVLIIGNSYAFEFREQLTKELNLLIESRIGPDQTTESFADFLRQPELLAHCRVIVWLSSEQHLTRMKPLPRAISDRLKTGTAAVDNPMSAGRSAPP